MKAQGLEQPAPRCSLRACWGFGEWGDGLAFQVPNWSSWLCHRRLMEAFSPVPWSWTAKSRQWVLSLNS